MQGWIKLYRKTLASVMYRQLNSKQRDVMMTVLLLANHESNEWEYGGILYKVKPGQFVTSLETLKQNCASDVSIQNIRTALVKLEKFGFLTSEPTNRNRLITLVNWGFYQTSDDELTSKPTGNQQATNKQLTTNKNVKNDKNVKKEKITYAEFVTMTEIEHGKLVTAHGDEKTKQMIDVLNNYKFSSGRKYASDYAAILKWVVAKVNQGSFQQKNYSKQMAGFDEEVAFQNFVREGGDPADFRYTK